MEQLSAFERLVELMTSLDAFDVPAIFSTLAELCKELRVSKGVTTFYPSPAHEQRGEGEPFVCYDSGKSMCWSPPSALRHAPEPSSPATSIRRKAPPRSQISNAAVWKPSSA